MLQREEGFREVVVGTKGFVEFVVAFYVAWVTELEAPNLGLPGRETSVAEELIIRNIKPKGTVITGKVIEIKAATLTDLK